MRYDWPGNVRELKSALEYAWLVAESGLVEMDHLPNRIQSALKTPQTALPVVNRSGAAGEHAEKMRLVEALQQSGGNQSRAAAILGVHRMTVFNRMRKYAVSVKSIIGYKGSVKSGNSSCGCRCRREKCKS